MKLYRMLVKMDNGCIQAGFYHEDKEFLMQALEVTKQQNPGFIVEAYLQEVEMPLLVIESEIPASEEVVDLHAMQMETRQNQEEEENNG